MQNDFYQAFLDAVCGQIRFRPARAGIADELRGHLEDRAEALRAQGLSDDEAARQAVAAMGDPAAVGRELDRAHPCAWNCLYWGLKRLTLSILGVLLVLHLLIGGIAVFHAIVPLTLSDNGPAVVWSADVGLSLTLYNHHIRVETVYQLEDGSISLQCTELVFPYHDFSGSAGVAVCGTDGRFHSGSGMATSVNGGLYTFTRAVWNFDEPALDGGVLTVQFSAAGETTERNIPAEEARP